MSRMQKRTDLAIKCLTRFNQRETIQLIASIWTKKPVKWIDSNITESVWINRVDLHEAFDKMKSVGISAGFTESFEHDRWNLSIYQSDERIRKWISNADPALMVESKDRVYRAMGFKCPYEEGVSPAYYGVAASFDDTIIRVMGYDEIERRMIGAGFSMHKRNEFYWPVLKWPSETLVFTL